MVHYVVVFITGAALMFFFWQLYLLYKVKNAKKFTYILTLPGDWTSRYFKGIKIKVDDRRCTVVNSIYGPEDECTVIVVQDTENRVLSKVKHE